MRPAQPLSGIADWLAENGIAQPTTADMVQVAVALGLVLAILFCGWVVGRYAGDRLEALWSRVVGGHGEGLAPRMGNLARHATAALLLALMSNAWVWNGLSAIGIGLAMGAAVALLARTLLRGLQLPRQLTWLVAAVLFVVVLSGAIRNATNDFNLLALLDTVGFSIGDRRYSLLSLATIAVAGIILFALVRLANRVIGHSIARAQSFDPAQKLLIQKLAGIAVLIAAFFVGIDFLQIDLTTFAVFGGALGLAVGFGLQKTVGNLIAGIILLMDRSIKPGDVIVVGDSFGWVNKIGVRAVSVITRDGKEHLIPNENLMTQEVENWSYSDRNVRVRIPVGVSYSCDLKLAQELMLRAAQESPRVLKSPKPNVWLEAFGESSVDHEVLVWINDPEGGVGNVKSDVLNRLWHLFQENGIEIPFPQRDVHVKSWSAPANGA
ncbi:mechanosensitive ion channel family protein [Stakelama saccharophila]|uniref:Mechanosensitive ion channel n=1 Tax=Stakelama saccharophila TaxID=3075605 RepID=A0ABZ0BCZ8_9SPHN|nr:mechanosensitive ion channel domain-containing protein [Stakelama sp. W311]WNO54159.1 mechanosensitive ion channel [Stakelama sp. W311]